MNYHQIDDNALFKLVLKADRQAFSTFYDRYANLVYSIAYNILGDQPLAEEIVQDVFLKIWKNLERYDPSRAKLNTWLSTITRYRAIDVLRKQSVRTKHASWVTADNPHRQDSPDLEERVDQRLMKNRVRQAMSQLPEEQHEALALAYFRGMTQREIADALDQPLGTVKTRIRLAMQKLRGLLVDERE